MTKTFTFLRAPDGTCRIHKAGCGHVERELQPNMQAWGNVADNVHDAIELDKQVNFEEHGGIGCYRDADPEEFENALAMAQDDYVIVNCANH